MILSILLFICAANTGWAAVGAFDWQVDQPRIGWLLVIATILQVLAGVQLWP